MLQAGGASGAELIDAMTRSLVVDGDTASSALIEALWHEARLAP